MVSNSNGIQGLSMHGTPIAVIDFELTGLMPELNRVVEVSVYGWSQEKVLILSLIQWSIHNAPCLQQRFTVLRMMMWLMRPFF